MHKKCSLLKAIFLSALICPSFASAASVFEEIFDAHKAVPIQYESLARLLENAESTSAKTPFSDRSSCIYAVAPFTSSPFGKNGMVDLKHPRLLRVFQINERPVYMGFVEKMHEAEVISWNDNARPPRFEFLLVKNVGIPGKAPIIEQANRTFCISCHQHEGPIFPKAQWEEFTERATGGSFVAGKNTLSGKVSEVLQDAIRNNPDNAITKMLIAFHPGRSYFGVDLEQYMIHNAELLGGFDSAVRIGTRRIVRTKICSQICDENIECRKLLLKTAVYNYLGNIEEASTNGRMGDACSKNPPRPKVDPPVIANNAEWKPFEDLINRDLFPHLPSDELPDRSPSFEPSKAGDLRSSMKTQPIGIDWVRSNAWSCFGLTETDRNILKKINRDDLLQRLGSPAVEATLQNWPPQRGRLMDVLTGKVTNPTTDPLPCAPETISASELAERLGSNMGPILGQASGATNLFQKHCDSCHGPDKPDRKINIHLPLDNLLKMRKYIGADQQSPLDRLEFGEMPRGEKRKDFEQDLPEMIKLLQGK